MPDFVSDLAAAVDHLGVEAVGVVWGVAHADWESAEQRDEFLRSISGKQGN